MRLTAESRLLLRIAALIVPAERRDEWGREWEGELWYWLTSTPQSTLWARLELARHCTGAIVDAFYLRVDGEELARNVRRTAGHPAFPIVAAMAMLMVIGAASGWFSRTRRALSGPAYAGAERIAILHEEGPLRGERHSVPAAKIADWDKSAASLEGAAVYFWYHSIFGAPAEDVRAAKVGPAFFEILGVEPALGRLFRRPDATDCRDCAVLSYESWRRERIAIGQSVIVDGRPMRLIGVLPRDFWFADARPAVWTLYVTGETWRVWDVTPAGALCLLQRGTTAAAAQAELRASSTELMPRSSGRWVTVTPIRSSVRMSLPFFVPFFSFFLGVAAILAVWKASVRAAGFGVLTAALSLTVVLLTVIEFTDGAQPFTTWAFVVASILVVYCSHRDLHLRCPVCLRRLNMPVRIGHAGQVLLEQAGTELVCPRGHGMLYTPEISVEAESWVRV